MVYLVSKGLVVPPGLNKLHSMWVPTPLNEKWDCIRTEVHEMLVPTGQQGCHIASRAAYNKLHALVSGLFSDAHIKASPAQIQFIQMQCSVFSSVCSQNASTFEATSQLSSSLVPELENLEEPSRS